MAELQAGRKQTLWMWHIFPQLRGLGQSPRSVEYGIGSLAEAQAHLHHKVLGRRLELATETVLARDPKTEQATGPERYLFELAGSAPW